jgi:nicotinate-nucleotide adenylyltransferase
MSREKRIALYGGTFDPVHVGHLEVARRVSELFEIDELLFVPAQLAPHKISRAVTPAFHRYAMLVLATQDDPALRVSTFEIEAPGRCYTVDTLARFNSELSGSAKLFFIMGADSWSEITTWHEWERLLTSANHIVVSRPGYDLALGDMTLALVDRLVDLRGVETVRARSIIDGCKGERIFFSDAVLKDVSASAVRRLARTGSSDQLKQLLPPAVAAYVMKYELYRDSNGR